MMERSSRFISLSGLSGVLAGAYALIGALAANSILDHQNNPAIGDNTLLLLVLIAMAVLLLTLLTGMLPTVRRTKKLNLKIWNSTTQRLVINLMIPLATGGIFIAILLWKGIVLLAAPLMLIFYGLALINASKYTLSDIRYLGISEIVLGLLATVFDNYGLLFWAIGFGVLHILYGLAMYYKYER